MGTRVERGASPGIRKTTVPGFTRRFYTRGETAIYVRVYRIGVPYGNRTRVAAVKEKRFIGIQRKPAASTPTPDSL